jgi:serine/threonine-protein kinase
MLSTRPLEDTGLEVRRLEVAGMALAFVALFSTVLLRSSIPRRVRLDLALSLQVLIAFALGWLEAPRYVGANVELFGVSVLCVWALLFPISIPARIHTVVVATLATIAALPATAGLLGHRGHEIDWSAVGGSTVLVFLCGGLGVGARLVVADLSERLAAAKTAGSYRLTEPLGKGSMGEVWLAEHKLLHRPAVVKFIRPGDTRREHAPEHRERFEREARATAALRSPHTIELYDYGVGNDGAFFYVMEKLDGFDLRALVKKFGPQEPGRVVHLLRQVCLSLAEAHGLGLVHRDIKPANIFTSVAGTSLDVVKVLDFGLVRATGAEPEGNLDFATMTMTGAALGTPATMAPEAVEDATQTDARTDLYGVGCVAYWLLCGERVFDTDDADLIMTAHLEQRPVPPSRRTGLEVPADLERLVLQCLEKDPEDRPAGARELAEALECCDCFYEWSREHAQQWWSRSAPELLVGSS